uniref:GAG-pre-integrase domain-containing protein n=1 Tax=Nicotiana tabacum TaxID=4097 RepID=A0A1S3YX22_TOBAC|nr:PREDICTED: uncharacterized protein LOC107780381 [Nicotiana tabacum]
MAGTINAFLADAHIKYWIVDSGATNHMDLYSGMVKGIGRESEGLYLFLQKSINNNNTIARGLTGIKENLNIGLWHRRLGHASAVAIKQILGLGQEECKVAIDSCTICPLARHTRLPFHNSTSRSSDIFELLHVDVWGPYNNEIAERKYRHILEIAREVRFQGGIPLKFWGHCVLAAVHNHDKFVARAAAGVMMGYSAVSKGYILYDLTNRVFFINRDVHFKEHIFSFKHKPATHSSLFSEVEPNSDPSLGYTANELT